MSTTSFSLENKVALVTGGRRGLGKAIALAFAGAGADVAICDNVVESGELGTVAEEIQSLGRRSLAVQTDVTRSSEVGNMVQRVMNELGVIDILVNNAGILGVGATLLETTEDEWDKVFDVDLKGCYLCSQAVGKEMVKQRRGNVINIASVGGLKVRRRGRGAAYSIAKAGIIMLTRILAVELASYNIRVNAIAPSMVRTEMAQRIVADPDAVAAEEARIPLGRLGEPVDIAATALFLASDASSYVTGHTVVVEGGQLA